MTQQLELTIPNTHTPTSSDLSANNLEKSLQKPHLTSRQHENTIKLEIAPKLQEQIRWLCEQISEVEWSATLFYTVHGENFDHPDFKIVAEELYLQDIGNSVYTEYKVTPEFIKILMENPRLRSMKKGHIHSHNHMSVFFSGTDTAEIMDNSEFHNYYLSLIVNNRNHMEAKIAYRVQVKTETTNILVYKDINGKEITTTDFNEEFSRNVYIYNCNIIKPYEADNLLSNRYNQIKTEKHKIAEEENKRVAKLKSASPQLSGLTYTNGDLFDQAWNEERGYFPMNNYKKSSKFTIINPVYTANKIESFLIDYLGKGIKNQSLPQVLGNLNKRISRNKIKIEDYFKEISKTTFNCYYNHFQTDPNCKNFDVFIVEAIYYLEDTYSNNYNYLISKICKHLDLKTSKI